MVVGWVEPPLPGGVDMTVQQLQRVHHWPVGAVRAAELERVEDAGQHPPVVVGVGPADLLAHPPTKQLLVDTGVLLAAADRHDPAHKPCRDLLESHPGPPDHHRARARRNRLATGPPTPLSLGERQSGALAGGWVQAEPASILRRPGAVAASHHSGPVGGADLVAALCPQGVTSTPWADGRTREMTVGRSRVAWTVFAYEQKRPWRRGGRRTDGHTVVAIPRDRGSVSLGRRRRRPPLPHPR
jgi:hypothetical protein